jgi:O-6-methylguanine DNA methyltransferase
MESIYYTELDSPIGCFQVGMTQRGICMFEFPIAERIELHKRVFSERFSIREEPPQVLLDELKKQVSAYFDGTLKDFSLPLDLIGTPFQVSVWEELVRVKYGTTLSYQELSQRLNAPRAIRAIARANGENRTALLVPCHRVIGKDGNLTGYSGELWRKEFLLEREIGQARLEF